MCVQGKAGGRTAAGKPRNNEWPNSHWPTMVLITHCGVSSVFPHPAIDGCLHLMVHQPHSPSPIPLPQEPRSELQPAHSPSQPSISIVYPKSLRARSIASNWKAFRKCAFFIAAAWDWLHGETQSTQLLEMQKQGSRQLPHPLPKSAWHFVDFSEVQAIEVRAVEFWLVAMQWSLVWNECLEEWLDNLGKLGVYT